MRFPTGGKAHEPQGMIRCNSEADSIVWMKEEMIIREAVMTYCSGIFYIFQSFFIPGSPVHIYTLSIFVQGFLLK